MSISSNTISLQEISYGAAARRIIAAGRQRAKALWRSFAACWKLFAGGGVWEFLLTIDTIVTAEKHIVAAGAMSAINTIAWGYFLYRIIEANTRRKESIIWMAVGSALGCMIGTWVLK